MNFSPLTGRAAPLPAANINTDLLLPARYLKKPRAGGYQDYFFHDLRFDAEGRKRGDFVLNESRYAEVSILVTGPNFGCGSSREGAVYALLDYGIRCVIGESFGDIFSANCAKNGLLTVRVPPDTVSALLDDLSGQAVWVTVNLPAQTIVIDDKTIRFDIEKQRKARLILGTDEIDETDKYLSDITAFEKRRIATLRNLP